MYFYLILLSYWGAKTLLGLRLWHKARLYESHPQPQFGIIMRVADSTQGWGTIRYLRAQILRQERN